MLYLFPCVWTHLDVHRYYRCPPASPQVTLVWTGRSTRVKSHPGKYQYLDSLAPMSASRGASVAFSPECSYRHPAAGCQSDFHSPLAHHLHILSSCPRTFPENSTAHFTAGDFTAGAHVVGSISASIGIELHPIQSHAPIFLHGSVPPVSFQGLDSLWVVFRD